MPRRKGRKFIDKKRDVLHTFKVVQRSQQDPLIADESAPQGVLIDSNLREQSKEKEHTYGVYFDDDYNYLQHLRGTKEAISWENADLEVYTIRRKDPKVSSKKLKRTNLQLPSSVFESYMEEPVGLLNKAAPVTGPQPGLDSDVLAGLDSPDIEDGDEVEEEEFDQLLQALQSDIPATRVEEESDNENSSNVHKWLSSTGNCEDIGEAGELELSEDFIYYEEKGGDENRRFEIDGELSDYSSDNSVEVCPSDLEDEEALDDVGSMHGMQRTYKSEETKSCFTNYSLSSSVLPRTELMSLLDDRFEEKFLKEYTDEQMGPLDGEDIDGFAGENSALFHQALEETRKELQKGDEDEDRVRSWVRKQIDNVIPREEMEEISIHEKEEPGEKWDCESILSTYSNIYNHPKCINTRDVGPRRGIVIDPATGMPERRKSNYLCKKNLEKLDPGGHSDSLEDEISVLRTLVSAISTRPKDETSEERRIRKAAVKEYRKARRDEKKVNKLQFKEEKKKQECKLIREMNMKSVVKI